MTYIGWYAIKHNQATLSEKLAEKQQKLKSFFLEWIVNIS